MQVFIKHMITILLCTRESIERFIEDPAFLRSYDSAPRPSPSPLCKLSLFLRLPVCRRPSVKNGEGRRGGRGAESYDR